VGKDQVYQQEGQGSAHVSHELLRHPPRKLLELFSHLRRCFLLACSAAAVHKQCHCHRILMPIEMLKV
jgi:hypothetical protein